MDYCSLCCAGFMRAKSREGSGAESTRILSENSEWLKSFEEKGYYRGSPDELKQVFFQIPWMWDRVCRAVLVKPAAWDNGDEDEDEEAFNNRFLLSGVTVHSHWDVWDTLHVPLSPHDFIIGYPGKVPDKVVQTVPIMVQDHSSGSYEEYCSYPMHERCWSLMTHILDVGLIEEHLDMFIQALHQRSQQDTFEEEKLVPELSYWAAPWKQHEAISRTDPRKYVGIYESMAKISILSKGKYHPRDPFNVMELRDLFNHLEKVQQASKDKSPNPKAKKSKTTRRTKEKQAPARGKKASTNSLSSNTSHILIPSDIILVILDLLPEFRDVKWLMRAFPQWKAWIPQSYLRMRCVNEFFLEEPLPAAEEFDWRSLYFNIDQLLENSHGWHNRKRIIENLEMTKGVFLELVDDKVVRSARYKSQ